MFALYLGHSPLYMHLCKCLHFEMLKYHLFINTKAQMMNSKV